MNEGTKKILKQAGLCDRVDAVEHGFCPTCNKPISKDEFKDELSKKEYQISGMCQACQDAVFTGGE